MRMGWWKARGAPSLQMQMQMQVPLLQIQMPLLQMRMQVPPLQMQVPPLQVAVRLRPRRQVQLRRPSHHRQTHLAQ